MILGKLDETLQQLKHISTGLGVNNVRSVGVEQLLNPVTPNEGASVPIQEAISDDLTSLCPSDCLEVPTANGSAECILTWPVFGGKWPPDLLSQELLTHGSSPTSDAQPDLTNITQRSHRNIDEERVPALVERFLHFVHPKNPILEARQLRERARRVSEHGFGWDALSCVVVCSYLLRVVSFLMPVWD